MDYLIGSKNEFFSFLDSISKQDKIAVLTHVDLDGIASAILLEEILNKKKVSVSFISFLNYKKNMLENCINELKEKNITKVFILDLNADSEEKGFEKLRKNFDVFLIDHHPKNEILKDTKNIIKTESDDCTTLAVYELGKEILDTQKWEPLVSATIIAEFSYKKKENFNFLKEKYSQITFDKIIDSSPGQIAIKINNAAIYYKNDLKKLYNIIKENRLNELNEIHKKIEKVINKEIENFNKKAEFSSEKKIYFYKTESPYPIASLIATILSKKDPEKSFVILSDEKGTIKVSARNQGEKDMNQLMREGIKGIEDATAGGHACASAAKIPKKYFKKFKENILYFA